MVLGRKRTKSKRRDRASQEWAETVARGASHKRGIRAESHRPSGTRKGLWGKNIPGKGKSIYKTLRPEGAWERVRSSKKARVAGAGEARGRKVRGNGPALLGELPLGERVSTGMARSELRPLDPACYSCQIHRNPLKKKSSSTLIVITQ